LSKNILWFRDVSKDDTAIVGGKGANLGELTKAGLPVPPGFIVTAQAYFNFLESADIDLTIEDSLKNIDVENSAKLNKAASQIQKEILNHSMPLALAKEISNAYQKLYTTSSSNFFVAVRSSATAEDLPTASFAGQQKTFLNISGAEEVIKAVRLCWASLFLPRAIYYRQINKFDHLKVGIAVPIQKMIQSEKSGIMFTVDPVTSDKEKIVIEAGWGLGEAIVSGSVTPDRYVVNKQDLKILIKEINKQDWKITKVGKENKHISLNKQDQEAQKLTEEEIENLAQFGKQIEDHYKFPQDTEWAIESGKIYFVQSRPVTTINQKSDIKNQNDKEINQKEGETTSKLEVILKGAAASLGIASGPVKILHKPTETDRVQKGDVLVTEMTTPDYVPAMKRACAIVTDTGGRGNWGFLALLAPAQPPMF